MKKGLTALFLTGLMTIGMLSCAKEEDSDPTEFQNGIFDRWMAKYHPEATRLDDGLTEGMYVEWFERNPGGLKLNEGYWFEVDYTGYNQNGDIFITRTERTAKQLGIYSYMTRYVPERLQYSASTLANTYALGQVIGLGVMGEGDSARFYMPYGLGFPTSYYSSGFTASNTDYGFAYTGSGFDIPTAGIGLIFEMKLNRVIKDIRLYEREQVERYAADSLEITDLADSVALGVYMKKWEINEEGDSVKTDRTIDVWYQARYIDGLLFDTNVDSVATANNRISSTMTLGQGAVHSFSYTGSADSYLPLGVQKALAEMKAGERATVVFVSEMGYGSEGKTQMDSNESYTMFYIPPYTPLVYDIHVETVTLPDDDEDDD